MEPTSKVLGIPLSVLTFEQALATVDSWIAQKERHYVCTLDVHALMEGQAKADIAEIYRSAGIAAPDGMPLVWLLRMRGFRSAERICGPDLMPALFKQSERRGYRHFLYGSSEATLSLLLANLKHDYPGAKIVGQFSPPFRQLNHEEERDIDELVNAAAPDIVWVGLGAPKQDLWMARHRHTLQAPVLIGVGAAFDMLAGTIARAPPFLRRSGCEWMFRVLQEPRRLANRYLQSNTKFVVKLIAENLQANQHQANG